MKATVSFEWRNIEEPTFEPEKIIRKALYDAGYSVGHIFVQGVFDEDKTKFFGVGDERLPHEEVVWKQHERMTK
jgi:hypothetical protein